MPPGDFIGLAEETGLIKPIGLWVLEEACTQLVKWSQSPHTAHWKVSVNVSARQFHQPDFVERVRRSLSVSGANPRRLMLELTALKTQTQVTMPEAVTQALLGKDMQRDVVQVQQFLTDVSATHDPAAYAEAEEAWRDKAQRTVDDAEMKYVVVHLHRMLEPAIPTG